MSSSGPGLPRPSRLLVVNHSEPSGARTTSRSLPYSPVKCATGVPSAPVSSSGTCHSRWPRSAANPDATGRDRRARWRCLVGWPGELGIGVRPATANSLDNRPAIVAPLLDPVDLVEAVLAEFGGVHPPVAIPRHALHVAVPDPALRGHPEQPGRDGPADAGPSPLRARPPSPVQAAHRRPVHSAIRAKGRERVTLRAAGRPPRLAERPVPSPVRVCMDVTAAQ